MKRSEQILVLIEAIKTIKKYCSVSLNEHLKELENLTIEEEKFDLPEITMFHACKFVTSDIIGRIALEMLFESEEKNQEPEHQEVLTLDDVLNGNFKSDFPDVQQTIDEIARLANEKSILR